MQILDGKKASKAIRDELKINVAQLSIEGKKIPHLAAILVGNNGASETYVAAKVKACEEIGFASTLIRFEEEVSETALLKKINDLNNDPDIDGILVQLPLPKHIAADKVISTIDPSKDVDGFHPYNIGRLAIRMPTLRSCTPYGVITLLKHIGETFYGREAVVVGASNHVGRPMGLELLLAGATVTTCHRFTTDLTAHVGQADILVVAAGKPGLVKGRWVKPGATVIDVGINRLDDGRLVGDVEFEPARERAAWITPVPGGVGPMTVAILLQNTLLAAERCGSTA